MELINCFYKSDEQDLDLIMAEAKDQSVLPLLYKELLESSDIADSNKWRKMYYQIVKNNLLNREAHIRLNNIMTSEGVPYVVIKGMASAMYYKEPSLRTMGDIDFLVKREDISLADKALRSNGLIRIDKGDEHGFHWIYKDGQLIWELHWEVPGIPQEGECVDSVHRYVSDIIEKSSEYDGYMIPSAFHHGLILLLHSASHLTTTGIGLRHVCDWAFFEDRFDNDGFRSLFETALREIGMWEFARVLTALSVKYLGVPARQWAEGVSEEIIDLLLEDIMDSGNFGVKDDQRINQAKLIRNDETRTITNKNISKTIVKNMNIRSRRAMPVTKKCPLLLPAGWIYVGGRHLVRMARGEKAKINVVEVVHGAEKRSKLYKELKLFE